MPTLAAIFGILPSLLCQGNPKYAGPPDQTGKVVAVTGGNAGIGYHICKGMLAANAKVYLCARSPEKALKAIDQLKKETGKDSIYHIQLDLSSLQSVTAAAKDILAKESALHVLFNNAGILGSNPGEKTQEGFEVQFGTNVLGHHVFTTLLLPVLTKTARESPNGTARVVSTGSFVQYMACTNELDFENLELGGPKGADSFDLYCRSKIGNSVWSNAMARRRTDADGVIFLTVNPGLIITGGLLQRREWATYLTARTISHPTSSGAVTLLYCGMYHPVPLYYTSFMFSFTGTSPDITKSDTGSYYVPWCKKGTPIDVTLDVKVQDRLYDVLECWRSKKLQ